MKPYLPNALILPALLLGLFVYYPGLSGGFLFDDQTNILLNERLKLESLNTDLLWQASISGHNGPLRRPVSMLTFAVNHFAAGPDPFWFKLTNLFIHVLTGIALFFLTRLLLTTPAARSAHGFSRQFVQWVSVLVASAWLLHPLNLTTVLYVVQRMAGLSALFTVVALIFYVWGRARLEQKRPGLPLILAGMFVFTPLAALSKENGLLAPMLMLVTEFTLFRFSTLPPRHKWALGLLFTVTVALPVAAVLVYLMARPDFLAGGYAVRQFTLVERVLTEPRVLWGYLGMILLPMPQRFGMFHDDVVVSQGLLDPTSTLLALAGLGCLLGAALFARRRAPLLAFGILFFLVGHGMESSVIPLELVHEHRNYLPQYGVLLALLCYLVYPYAQLQIRSVQIFASIALVLLLATLTYSRANYWGHTLKHAVTEVRHHPDSARTNYWVGTVFGALLETKPQHSEELYALARGHFERATSLKQEHVDSLVALVILSYTAGKPVEEQWLDELRHRLRTEVLSASAIPALVSLVRCHKVGTCSLPPQDMLALLSGAEQNSSVNGRRKSGILFASSDYLANVIHDYPKAVEKARRAGQAAPGEIQNYLNLATLLVAVSQFDEAGKQLARARRLDVLGGHASKIDALEGLLTLAERSVNPVRRPAAVQ